MGKRTLRSLDEHGRYDPWRTRPLNIPAKATQPPGYDWPKECDRLTDQIGRLADKAQALMRTGKHDEADRLRAEAKKLSDERAAITRRNKGK